MNHPASAPAVHTAPAPFRDEPLTRLRHGIFDDETVDVMINERRDFAYLHPRPEVDYSRYMPRVATLGLKSYKTVLDTYTRRVEKVAPYLEGRTDLLDIGTGDALFLKLARSRFPRLRVAACERDQNTLAERRQVVGDETYDDLADLVRTGRTFSAISLMHVLEHLPEPASCLDEIRRLMTADTVLIVEIPSLNCPLLSLYKSAVYEKFYFQRQHPYNYSHASLRRLLEFHGFRTTGVISFQRYGLENHLQWLAQGRPGGNADYLRLFEHANPHYLAALEQSGHTDSAIWVGTRE